MQPGMRAKLQLDRYNCFYPGTYPLTVFEAFIDTLTIMGLAGLSIVMLSIAKLTEGSKLLSD